MFVYQRVTMISLPMLFFHILGIGNFIIPTDFHSIIFFRGMVHVLVISIQYCIRNIMMNGTVRYGYNYSYHQQQVWLFSIARIVYKRIAIAIISNRFGYFPQLYQFTREQPMMNGNYGNYMIAQCYITALAISHTVDRRNPAPVGNH